MTPPLPQLRQRIGARLADLDRRRGAHRLLLAAIPFALVTRFDPRAATDLDARLELTITDSSGRGPVAFALTVRDGRCAVRRGPAATPQATATLAAEDMLRLASGRVGWAELLSAGRLQFGGDPYLGLRVPSLFRLAAASPLAGPRQTAARKAGARGTLPHRGLTGPRRRSRT